MLRRILRIAGLVVVLAAAGLLVAAFGARFHDGPLGPFPGGPFRTAPETRAPEDWGFVDAAPTVELQVGREDPRSVTTWAVVQDGAVYLPSGFAARKTWPHVAERDPRVLLRVGGRVFERRAVRVQDAERRRRLAAALQRKYALGEGSPGTGDETWWFRLDDPQAAGAAPSAAKGG